MSAGAIVAIVGMAAILLCGGVVVAVLGFAGAGSESEPFVVGSSTYKPSNYATSQSRGQLKIVLEVTGTGPADISYNVMGTGGSEHDVALPWTKEIGPSEGLIIVSMLAQTKSSAAGAAIHGKITYGGKVVECDGKGAYSIATCTGDNT